MIKSELVQRIAADHPDLHRRDVDNVVDLILDTIADALVRGDRVEVRGVGIFSTRRRDARPGRNPRTGEVLTVNEKAFAVFRASKTMRKRLNPGQAISSG